MESNQPEDAKSSSEDSDNKKEQLNEDAGTGRFYECVFCKRGFTTAQALGGHMNIHRRDRARNKQPTQPSVSNQTMEDISRSGVLSPFPGHSSFFSSARESQMKSQMYFPSSESSSRNKYGYTNEEMHSNKPWSSLSLFEENPHTNLSLQITPTDRADKPEEKQQETEEADDVDLVLRLGHDP